MKSDRPAAIASWRRSGESRSILVVTPKADAISRDCSLSESASGLFWQQQTLPGGGVSVGAGAEEAASVSPQQQSLFAGSAPTHSCRTCCAAAQHHPDGSAIATAVQRTRIRQCVLMSS